MPRPRHRPRPRRRDPGAAREVAEDPGRWARFEREAKAVAALNHENTVTSHAIGEGDGVRQLATELVEGETLDRRIPETALPTTELLAQAVLIASALAAAGAKGIVHRDLEPAYVVVPAEGKVKVLDFGLAKLTHADDPPDRSARNGFRCVRTDGEVAPETTVAIDLPVCDDSGAVPVEDRFKVSLLIAGGMARYPPECPREAVPLDFMRGSTVPVLMLNVRDDFTSPVETEIKPMFALQGAPPGDERLVLLDGGHVPDKPIEFVREALARLDRYLGSVNWMPSTTLVRSAFQRILARPARGTGALQTPPGTPAGFVGQPSRLPGGRMVIPDHLMTSRMRPPGTGVPGGLGRWYDAITSARRAPGRAVSRPPAAGRPRARRE